MLDSLTLAFSADEDELDRLRAALQRTAKAINACTVCAGEGWPVCAMCVVWEAERMKTQAFDAADNLEVIG
jgi:recombinational DNA repair protein RecR